MKKLLFMLLTVLGLFLIYRHFDNHKVNYVSIGDGLIRGMNYLNQENYGYNDFIKDYLLKNNRIASFNNSFYNQKISRLTKDIKDNRTIRFLENEYFFKKVLRESDFLVISVGMEELAHNYDKDNMDKNYIFLNTMYLDIENLIKEIKKYAQGVIIFVGYYNPTSYYDSKTDEFFCDIDIKLNRLMMENDIAYLDMYELVKGNRYKESVKTPFLNVRGYEKLAESIKFYLQ